LKKKLLSLGSHSQAPAFIISRVWYEKVYNMHVFRYNLEHSH